MNTTGSITCPCCGEKIIVNYDDISGFSIDSLYFSRKLTEKLNAAKQKDITLKLQVAQQEKMDYNLKQCCCVLRGKYDK